MDVKIYDAKFDLLVVSMPAAIGTSHGVNSDR